MAEEKNPGTEEETQPGAGEQVRSETVTEAGGEEKVRRLPDFFYNWISLAGGLIALVIFTIIVALAVIDIFAYHGNPYLSLLTYLMLPGVLVGGLALMVLGALYTRYRQSQGRATLVPTEINIELRNYRHRNAVIATVVIGTIFLLATAIGSFKAYEATESVAFCGKLCHQVMSPEYITYHNSTHARVDCVDCHIGPGAEWFVKAKIGGLYQIYATLLNKYPRPIETPIENLRPARETCMECHWPDKFYGSRDIKRPHYLSDEKNTPYPIRLSIKIGGGTSAHTQMDGVHWHVADTNKVEYIPRDKKRLDIPWVRVTDAQGNVREYINQDKPLTEAEKATAKIRTMDCMDCHNRPSHNYRPPMHTVNEAMAAGRISVDLPFIKRESIKALDKEYEDLPKALAGIEADIANFYRDNYIDLLTSKKNEIAGAIEELKTIYSNNIFPEMKITWRVYPTHLGHSLDPGCFRCHGTELTTKDGQKITGDCNTCHTLLSQGETTEVSIAPGGLVFQHPVDIDGEEKTGHCTDCHSGGSEIY